MGRMVYEMSDDLWMYQRCIEGRYKRQQGRVIHKKVSGRLSRPGPFFQITHDFGHFIDN